MSDASDNPLSLAPTGIFSFTEKGLITAANLYCHQVLEFDAGELVGKSVDVLLTVAGRIFYQTHFYPLVKLHKHAEEIFLQFCTKSMGDLPVVLNAVLTSADQGEQVVCSFIPVRNRGKYEDEILLAKKKAEEALRQNEQLESIRAELEKQQKQLDK